MKRRVLVFVLATAVIAATETSAQSQGEIVEFIVDTNFANDILTGAVGDVVIFTGRSQGTAYSADCEPDQQGLLQPVVIIDPGEGRATRYRELIVIFRDTPIRTGTRVGNLQPLGNCNGTAFTKFVGIVE